MVVVPLGLNLAYCFHCFVEIEYGVPFVGRIS